MMPHQFFAPHIKYFLICGHFYVASFSPILQTWNVWTLITRLFWRASCYIIGTILKLFLCSLKIDDEIESESVVTMQLTVDLSVSKKFYSKSF